MRLLRAELRKLYRPLLPALVLAAVVLIGVLVRQQVVDGSGAGGPVDPSLLRLESPTGIGTAAAQELATMLGAVLMLFLAGAHVAGEWSGRTIGPLLAGAGRRGQVLLAKLVSLWLAGLAALLTLWLLLAAWSLALVAFWPLPGRPGLGAGLAAALPQVLRASAVLGVFAALGVCTAALTRSMLGTVLAGASFLSLVMELGNMPSLTRYSPSAWVDGWMGLRPPVHGAAPLAIWNTATPPGVAAPGMAAGAVGLVLLAAVLAVLAWARLGRLDVTA